MADTFEGSDLAGGGKGAGSRVSMQNVAAYAGVSIATVSKVMQGVSTVLPENVTKVQNAIEALGYRINPLGAELRRGRRNLVGLIVPTFDDPPLAKLVMALELEVERRGHVLFVGSSHGSEKREADIAGRMLDWRVGGIIVLPVKGQKSAAAMLLDDAAVPAVFVQPRQAASQRDTVLAPPGFNADGVAAEAVQLLFLRIGAP
jgi:LacI family transcriptional regulator